MKLATSRTEAGALESFFTGVGVEQATKIVVIDKETSPRIKNFIYIIVLELYGEGAWSR